MSGLATQDLRKLMQQYTAHSIARDDQASINMVIVGVSMKASKAHCAYIFQLYMLMQCSELTLDGTEAISKCTQG